MSEIECNPSRLPELIYPKGFLKQLQTHEMVNIFNVFGTGESRSNGNDLLLCPLILLPLQIS